MPINSIGSSSFVNDPSCHICLEPFDDSPEQTVVALACPKRHIYHHNCIDQWFRRLSVQNRKCLICYANAVPIVVVRKSIVDRLCDACLENNTSAIEQILQNNPERANEPVCNPSTGDMDSLFSIALKEQNQAAALALINHGLNVNNPIQYGPEGDKFPLHLAAEQGEVTVVVNLLKKGAAVNCLLKSSPGNKPDLLLMLTGCLYTSDTPIGLAVKQGHPAVVKQLIDAGSTAPLFQARQRNDALLLLAIDCKQTEIVRLLLLLGEFKRSHTASLDHNISPGEYVDCLLFGLFKAVKSGHLPIVEVLLGVCNTERGRSESCLLPLWYAIGAGKKEMVETMLKAGFNNKIHFFGQSLREYALECNNQEAVKLIDKYDADFHVAYKDKVFGMFLRMLLETLVPLLIPDDIE